MKSHRIRRLRIASLAACATLALSLSAAPQAFAADSGTPPGGETPSLEQLQSLSETTMLTTPSADESTGVNALPMNVNPSGCYGQTDNPHLSTKYTGQASVHGSTACPVAVSLAYVKTTLYRHDWFGLNYMNADDASASGVWSGKISATPHSSCDNAPSRTYSGYSYHEVTVGGAAYAANTTNTTTFACN